MYRRLPHGPHGLDREAVARHQRTRLYGAMIEARRSIGKWLEFYNDERPHQALDYRTPREIFEGEACEHVDNASASLRDTSALPTCSQAHRQEKEVIMY